MTPGVGWSHLAATEIAGPDGMRVERGHAGPCQCATMYPMNRRAQTGTKVPGMTEIGPDWRVVDGVATAWFDAPSLIEGAALAGRIVELSAEIVVDLRATGMRVRLDSDEHAEAVSAAARDLGLAANPAVLQHLSVVFESANPTVVRRFWQRVLDYEPGEDAVWRSVARTPARIGLDGAAPLETAPPRRGAAGRGVEQALLVSIRTVGVCHTADGTRSPGAGNARREDRDSRLAGGVQRDGVLPHHLADAAA